MSAEKDRIEADAERLIASDPDIQRLHREWQATQQQPGDPFFGEKRRRRTQIMREINERLQALGVPPNFKAELTDTGQLRVDHQNWVERHPDATIALLAGGAIGGGLVAPALLGGAGATGAAAPAGATATGAGAGAGGAGATGATTAGATAAGSSLPGWAGALFDVGKLGLGTLFAHRAANKANAAQQQATDTANKNLEPYANIGGQAFSTLGALMGLGGGGGATPSVPANAGPVPMSQPAQATAPQPSRAVERSAPEYGATLASLAPRQTQSSYQTVRMQSPDGAETQDVPVWAVQHFLQQGARRVG